MTAEQLREVQAAGHCIGGHGFDHVPYNTLTPQQQAADMQRAQATLAQICGARPRPLSYPFGRFSPETEALARDAGYTYCFTTDERVDAKWLPDHLAGLGD
jgi:peptidoglycan/xylan/chitin deacetylase (PgdA/CDA1 family)